MTGSLLHPGLQHDGRLFTLQQRYDRWRQTPDGREVFATVRNTALALRRRGFTHYGVAALFEAARYARALRVGPDDLGFRLNNDWRSRMARELMTEPEFVGMFDTRELRA